MRKKAIEIYELYYDEGYTCDCCGTPFIPADDVEAGFEEGHSYAFYKSAECPCCGKKFDPEGMERFGRDDRLQELKELANEEGINLIFHFWLDDELITAETTEELTAKIDALGYDVICLLVEDVLQDTENDNGLIVVVF